MGFDPRKGLRWDWLENIRVTGGTQTFTDIVEKVQGVLSRAATAKDDQRAADALAHLGWGDFLRSREGQGGRDPAPLWRLDPDLEVEAVRVANDMRIKSEPWAAGAEGRTSGIRDIYYRRLVNKNDAEAFLAAMPAKDLLDTYVWLLRGYDNSSNGVPYRFMLAQLQENSGARPDALASYQAVLAMLKAKGLGASGSLPDATQKGIRRLQRP